MTGKWLSIKYVILALALVALLPAGSRAATQEELIEKIKLLEIQIQQLKELRAQQRMSAEKEQQCVTATGEKKLCTCLAEALPADVGFERYVHVAVSTSEELRYDSLTPEERKSIDAIRAAREKCTHRGLFK